MSNCRLVYGFVSVIVICCINPEKSSRSLLSVAMFCPVLYFFLIGGAVLSFVSARDEAFPFNTECRLISLIFYVKFYGFFIYFKKRWRNAVSSISCWFSQIMSGSL